MPLFSKIGSLFSPRMASGVLNQITKKTGQVLRKVPAQLARATDMVTTRSVASRADRSDDLAPPRLVRGLAKPDAQPRPAVVASKPTTTATAVTSQASSAHLADAPTAHRIARSAIESEALSRVNTREKLDTLADAYLAAVQKRAGVDETHATPQRSLRFETDLAKEMLPDLYPPLTSAPTSASLGAESASLRAQNREALESVAAQIKKHAFEKYMGGGGKGYVVEMVPPGGSELAARAGSVVWEAATGLDTTEVMFVKRVADKSGSRLVIHQITAKSLGTKGAAAHTLASSGRESAPTSKAAVDPMRVFDEHGVARGARVGQLGADIGPPIRRVDGDLPKAQRAVEAEAIGLVDTPEKLTERAAAYLSMVKKARKEKTEKSGTPQPMVFETDKAKAVLWPGIKGQGIHGDPSYDHFALYNVAVHAAANAVAKKAFEMWMSDPEGGKNGDVLVTAGGCAAGKSYALTNAAAATIHPDTVIWDAAGEQCNTELPWIAGICDKADAAMKVFYVEADPEQSWAGKFGCCKRSQEVGRMVSPVLFVDSYLEGQRNLAAFHKWAKESSPNIEFICYKAGGIRDFADTDAAKFDARTASAKESALLDFIEGVVDGTRGSAEQQAVAAAMSPAAKQVVRESRVTFRDPFLAGTE